MAARPMNSVKVLVVGTGSIGRRHIANLLNLGVQVSSYSYRGTSVIGADPVTDLAAALQSDFDAVVVANKTDQHLDVAIRAAHAGKHLFIEKPVATCLAGCEELQNIVQQRSLVVEAGFMLRFHPNLLWIKQSLDEGVLGDVMYLSASVGQWLPDWRPDSDYRNSYSAFRSSGGGVIFDLIHELDLVYWLAGEVAEVSAMTRYVESLAIETEAIAQVGLRLNSGVLAQVHLDYVRPAYKRQLEIVGTRGVLSWDYLTNEVSLTRGDGAEELVHGAPFGFERNTMFQSHMAVFLERITKAKAVAASPLNESIEVLKIALACHQSAEKNCWVVPSEINSSYQPKVIERQ